MDMFNGNDIKSMMNSKVESKDLTDADVMEMMDLDEETMNYIADVQASADVQSGSFALKGSDVANQKTVIVLTNEDLARALELPMVRQQMESQISVSDPYMTAEELSSEVNQQLADAKQMIMDSDMTVTISEYTNDGEFVAMEVLLTENENSVAQSVSFTVTKTTADYMEFYQMTATIDDGESSYQMLNGSLYYSDEFISGSLKVNDMDNEPVATANFTCDTYAADQTSGELSGTVYSYGAADGTLLAVFDQTIDGDTTDTTIDLYTSSGSVDDLKADLMDNGLISLNINTVTQPDSGFFADLQSAAPETSAQLLTMTEDELNAYMQAVQQSLMMTVFTIIDNLPPDVSDALMQSMGGAF